MVKKAPDDISESGGTPSTDGFLALIIAGIIGGAAPYLLRIAMHLWKGMENSEAINIPQASVWMGIAIFGILGLAIAFIFADRHRRQYFTAAMMAPALITNAAVGLDNAGKEKVSSGLGIVGTASAQTDIEQPDLKINQKQLQLKDGRFIQMMLNLQDIPAANADKLKVTMAGQNDVEWSQYCPIAKASTCALFVPTDADEMKFSAGGINQTVDIPDWAAGIDVGLTAKPSAAQQLWFALGGSLSGEITGIEVQPVAAQ